MLVISLLLSHGTVRLLRSSLMGYHPQELLKLYLRQDTVLNAMEEGILASDLTGTVVFANQPARGPVPSRGGAAGPAHRPAVPGHQSPGDPENRKSGHGTGLLSFRASPNLQ